MGARQQHLSPTDKHQKRLHFIVFVDAARTRSFSLKISYAWIFVALVLTSILSTVFAFVLLVQSQNKIATMKNYIVDIKRGLFAQSIATQDILTSEFIAQGYKGEGVRNITSIVHELANTDTEIHLKDQNEKRLEEKTTESLTAQKENRPSLPTKALTQPLTVASPKPQSTPIARAETAPPKPQTTLAAKALPVTPVKFGNIAITNDEEEPGNINISFDLQNLSGRLLTGWVCAAITLQDQNENEIVRAAPTSVTLNTGSKAPLISTCRGGELVKFNRFRPTVLSTAGTKDQVKTYVLYFTDSGSGQQHAFQKE